MSRRANIEDTPEAYASGFTRSETIPKYTEEESTSFTDKPMGEKTPDTEIAVVDDLDNSPYPEVRAAVEAGDEDVPASTFRAWFLGLIFVTIGSGLNMLFNLRAPSIILTSIVAQLLSYPCGVWMAKYLPTKKFRTFGCEWSLNPGPFNKKEHCLIVIMSNVSYSTGPSYAVSTIEAMMGFVSVLPIFNLFSLTGYSIKSTGALVSPLHTQSSLK
jgi:hypothetical protein